MLEFLLDRPGVGYTPAELAERTGVPRGSVGPTLQRLETAGPVRHNGPYWATTTDRERVLAAYDLHAVTGQLDRDDGGIDPGEWDAVVPEVPHPSERADEDE